MAYNDYGAFVWRNGERRTDKEDAPLFASDEETFGADIDSIPSGARIFAALIRKTETSKTETKNPAPAGGAPMSLYHGVLGDGAIRVGCYKQGLPSIWEMTDEGPQRVRYFDDEKDVYDYEPFAFEYKGFHFEFVCGDGYPGSHDTVIMKEPDGAAWQCHYGCSYGAGFEEE